MFFVQYAKMRKIKLYYNFFDKYCDVTKSEGLEMDKHSLYLALSEHEMHDWSRPAMEKKCRNFCAVERRLYEWIFSPFNNKFLPSYFLR